MPSAHNYDKDVHINIADVAVDSILSPYLVRVTIKKSKTDKFRRCVDIYMGKTRKEICPVGAIMAYITTCSRGKEDGLFFRFESSQMLKGSSTVSTHVYWVNTD